MHDQFVLALGVQHLHAGLALHQPAGVAHLAAPFRVERGAVQHHLVAVATLAAHLPVAEDPCLSFQFIVPGEDRFPGAQLGPVARLHGGGRAAAVLLLLQLGLEAGHVHLHPLLAAHQLREVDGEAVGVVQLEGLVAGELLPALGDQLLQALGALFQRAQEALLLLLHHVHDQLLLLLQLGELATQLTHQHGHQLVQEGLLQPQEAVAVAHGTPQDPPDHVARPGVSRQLPVRDGEGDGPQVVGAHAHGDVGLVSRP